MRKTPTNKDQLKTLEELIVESLENVKGVDIKVFDTQELSSLFERIVIATGNSNRQTKALAASVRDELRKADLPKPRIEGETNGEWIIVDCGPVVVHIMQPVFRQYYHLEELWGEKLIQVETASARAAKIRKENQSNDLSDEKTPAKKRTAKRPAKKSAVTQSVEKEFETPKKVFKKSVVKKPVAKETESVKAVKTIKIAPRKVPSDKTSMSLKSSKSSVVAPPSTKITKRTHVAK
jgi:ribosome-associated protein